MDYQDLLLTLNPFLRRRLKQIAALAEVTELEALSIIVESGLDDVVDVRSQLDGEQSI